jgi:hypothetical protein
VRRFHKLEAAIVSGINPTGEIDNPFRQHPTSCLESLANRSYVLQMFDDHEEHGLRIAEVSEFINKLNDL